MKKEKKSDLYKRLMVEPEACLNLYGIIISISY